MILYDKTPIRTAGTAVYPYDPVIEEIFKIKPKFGDPESMAVRVGNTLHVPRECVPLGAEDHRVYKTPIAINCKVPPRNDDQERVIAESVDLLQRGVNHILKADTGFGKTYCGSNIACQMGQPTLIIVTKEDLVRSWKKCLVNLVGVPLSQIGHIQQDVCDYKGKRFVIAMIHSLVKEDKYDAQMRNYFGMVIFDECHHLAAENFVIACRMFPAAIRLGLTATDGRSDGRWPVIEAHIGPVLVRGTIIPMHPKVIVRQTGWQIPVVPRWVDSEDGGRELKHVPIPHQPGRMMGVYKAMGEDLHRNKIIMDYVVACIKKERRVVILSDLVDGHLKPLFHQFSKEIPGEYMDYYIGGRSDAQLEVAKMKPVVLATYQMCGEGTDVPEWDSLVFATPRAQIKQPLGRIIREMEGKKEPAALDLVDDSALFRNFYLSREKQYYELKAKIVKMGVNK